MGGMIALMFGLLFPWLSEKTSTSWPIWPFILMTTFWAVALLTPQILKPINEIWNRIGNILGFINSKIILGLMFFFLILPIGLLLKLFGKDSMDRKYDKNLDSYRKTVTPRNREHLEKPF